MALAIDGIDDYVVVFDSPTFDLTSPLTLCMWFYSSGVPDTEFRLVLKEGPDSYGHYGLWLFETDSIIIYLYPVSIPCKYISPGHRAS